MAQRLIDAEAFAKALLFHENTTLDADAVLFVLAVLGEQPTFGAWRSSEHPPEKDEVVLVKASGRWKNLRFVEAVLLASFSEDGWMLEDYPSATDFTVSYWAPVPKEGEK